MSKEGISYNDITKQFVNMSEEKRLSLNARFDTKPEDMKVIIWGYELCNGVEWKDFLDVVNKLGKEKTDLEIKLAESEVEIELARKTSINTNKIDIINLQAENLELKQQLTEKKKEIAYMTKQAKKFNNEAQKYFEDAYCNDTIYQDKISFALEELEKAKETTECVLDNALKNCSLNQSYYDRLLGEIDNQIKQLKEQQK